MGKRSDILGYKEEKPVEIFVKKETVEFWRRCIRQAELCPAGLKEIIHINGWEIISYQELGIPPRKPSEVIFCNNRIIIIIDNRLESGQLKTYTAHEIGHIVLKHYRLHDPEVYEAEADVFAEQLLRFVEST